MKVLKYLLPVLIASFLGLGQPLIAQPLQKHNHSLRLQMGLFQYNENTNDFISQNNNDFLSGGLTYRREIGRIFALNLTGRYNEWNMDEKMRLQTYAFQALWEVHAFNLSSSWRTKRITPYIGAGIGYENHNLTNRGKDTVQQKVYIPFEVGVLFNMSPRWSIGVFSEYKLASVSPLDNLLESPKLRLDLSNIAGVSLSYNFGRNKKQQSVPVIRTNQSLVQKRTVKEVAKETAKVTAIKEVKDSKSASLDNKAKDSTLSSLDAKVKDSTIVVSKEAVADSTTMALGKVVADSTMILPEKTVADSTMVLDKKVADSTFVLSGNNLVDGILPSDSTDKSVFSTPIAIDSTAVRKDTQVLSKKIEIIVDTIRVPVILDITVNAQNYLTDSNYAVANTAKTQPAQKGAVASPAPVYYEVPNQQMQGQLGQIDNNISALKEQYRQQNKSIESELKSMKVMLGVLNAEILLLSAVKSKAPNKEKEVKYVTSPAPTVNIDSLAYLIESINNQNGVDSVNLTLTNTNVTLLAELKRLQSENKELYEKLDRISKVEPAQAPVPDLPENIVHTITFAVNSTKVDVVQLIQLKSMLDLLKSKPDYKLLLSGFADKSGNASYNMALSKKRVAAVKAQLNKMGINKARIVEQYFGSEKASAAHNENDRKVELKVVKSF